MSRGGNFPGPGCQDGEFQHSCVVSHAPLESAGTQTRSRSAQGLISVRGAFAYSGHICSGQRGGAPICYRSTILRSLGETRPAPTLYVQGREVLCGWDPAPLTRMASAAVMKPRVTYNSAVYHSTVRPRRGDK